MSTTILVHDRSGALWSRLDELVEEIDGDVVLLRSTEPAELGRILTDQHVDVLVAGPGLDSRSGFARLRIIRDELPRLVVLLAMGRLEHHEAGMVVAVGAIDHFAPTADRGEVRRALERALAMSHTIADPAPIRAEASTRVDAAPQQHHRVTTVASASGGSGKTFLATNLAWFLASTGNRRTCLIDLDLQFGEVTAALQLRPRYTITDLLQHGDHPASPLEGHIEEFLEQHEAGFSVLAAPRSPGEASTIHPADVLRVIDAAKRHFDEVVIDTPPTLSETMVTAARRADELLVMATLDIPSVRNLQVLMDALEAMDVPIDEAHLILNKVERDSGIEVRDVAELFPRGFDAALPYAHEAQLALNSGQPVMAHRPMSAIAHDLTATFARYLPEAQRMAIEAQQAESRPRAWRWHRRHQAAVAS